MGDQRADAQARRLSRECGEKGPGFVVDDPAIAEGIDKPGAIEAELLRFAPTARKLGERPTGEGENPKAAIHCRPAGRASARDAGQLLRERHVPVHRSRPVDRQLLRLDRSLGMDRQHGVVAAEL